MKIGNQAVNHPEAEPRIDKQLGLPPAGLDRTGRVAGRFKSPGGRRADRDNRSAPEPWPD